MQSPGVARRRAFETSNRGASAAAAPRLRSNQAHPRTRIIVASTTATIRSVADVDAAAGGALWRGALGSGVTRVSPPRGVRRHVLVGAAVALEAQDPEDGDRLLHPHDDGL